MDATAALKRPRQVNAFVRANAPGGDCSDKAALTLASHLAKIVLASFGGTCYYRRPRAPPSGGGRKTVPKNTHFNRSLRLANPNPDCHESTPELPPRVARRGASVRPVLRSRGRLPDRRRLHLPGQLDREERRDDRDRRRHRDRRLCDEVRLRRYADARVRSRRRPDAHVHGAGGVRRERHGGRRDLQRRVHDRLRVSRRGGGRRHRLAGRDLRLHEHDVRRCAAILRLGRRLPARRPSRAPRTP